MSLPASPVSSRPASPQVEHEPLGADGPQRLVVALEAGSQVSGMVEQASERMKALSLSDRFIAPKQNPSTNLEEALKWQGRPTPPCFWYDPLAYCCWEFDIIKTLINEGKVVFTGSFANEIAGAFTRLVPIWKVVKNNNTFVCRGGVPVTPRVHPKPVECSSDGHFYNHCEAMGLYPESKNDKANCMGRPNPVLMIWNDWGLAKVETQRCYTIVQELQVKLNRLKDRSAECSDRARNQLSKTGKNLDEAKIALHKAENTEVKLQSKYQKAKAQSSASK